MGHVWYFCTNCDCGHSRAEDLYAHIRCFSDCFQHYEKRGIAIPEIATCPHPTYYCSGCDWDFNTNARLADHLNKVEHCRNRYIHQYGAPACTRIMAQAQADHIKKVKQNEQARRLMQRQKETYPTDSEKSGIRLYASDEASTLLRKLANIFRDVRLAPDEKCTREYMTSRFDDWATMLGEHYDTSIELLYPKKELQIVFVNPAKSKEWIIEIVGTDIRITGLSSYEAANVLADQIKANPDAWVK